MHILQKELAITVCDWRHGINQRLEKKKQDKTVTITCAEAWINRIKRQREKKVTSVLSDIDLHKYTSRIRLLLLSTRRNGRLHVDCC